MKFAVKLASVAALAVLTATLLTAPTAGATTGYIPTGSVDNVYNGVLTYSTSSPSYLPITGWAADADARLSAIPVRADFSWTQKTCRVLVGCITVVVGQSSLTQSANGYRSDLIGKVGPGDLPWGAYHGFTFYSPPAPVPVGSFNGEQVCLTAVNVGGGSNKSLGCFPLVYQPIV